MDDLVQWLGEQLDEDEQIVYAADDSIGKTNLDWVYQPEDELGGKVASARGADLIPDVAAGVGAHVAEHDPRRVLREIEAKRRTVTRMANVIELGWDYFENTTVMNLAEQTLRDLASGYAGRPGYKAEEWTVSDTAWG